MDLLESVRTLDNAPYEHGRERRIVLHRAEKPLPRIHG